MKKHRRTIALLLLQASSGLSCADILGYRETVSGDPFGTGGGSTATDSTGGSATTIGGGSGGGSSTGGSASTGGGGSSSGGGPACRPGSSEPCYSGSPETENVGECKAGMKICNPEGSSYGPCNGEVLPNMENCATAADEDCLGVPDCGATLWSKFYGHTETDIGYGVAIDADGNILLTGSAAGQIDFGPGPIMAGGAGDVFVAKLSPAGEHLWAYPFGDAQLQRAYAVATDPSNNVLVTGSFASTLNFGGPTQPLMSDGGSTHDIFLAKLSKTGAPLWSRRFGNAGSDTAYDVAIDGFDVVISGRISGAVSFGGTTFDGTGDAAFVAKFDAAGNHLWSASSGPGTMTTVANVATDALGNVIVAGSFQGTMNFGGGALMAAGSTDMFVTKFDATGGHLWSKRFGDQQAQDTYSVVADKDGSILVIGTFIGILDFGAPTAPLTFSGSKNVFVVKLDPDGKPVWSMRYGEGNTNGYGIATDPSSNLVLVGSFGTTIDFGCGEHVGADSNDIFVTKIDSTSKCIWSHAFFSSGDQYSQGVAIDAVGGAVVVGQANGMVDFQSVDGGGVLSSAGGTDVFVARFVP